jgi:hypothetical protein
MVTRCQVSSLLPLAKIPDIKLQWMFQFFFHSWRWRGVVNWLEGYSSSEKQHQHNQLLNSHFPIFIFHSWGLEFSQGRGNVTIMESESDEEVHLILIEKEEPTTTFISNSEQVKRVPVSKLNRIEAMTRAT